MLTRTALIASSMRHACARVRLRYQLARPYPVDQPPANAVGRRSAGSRSSSSPSWPPSGSSARSRCCRSTAPSRPDLDDPATLTDYQLPEETVVYDRTGEVELARFGDFKREIVDLRGDPAGPARRDDRHRGQDVLGERRLRPGRRSSRPASTRCAATAAAPRRSPSSWSVPACSTRSSSRTRTGRPSASSRRSSSRSG